MTSAEWAVALMRFIAVSEKPGLNRAWQIRSAFRWIILIHFSVLRCARVFLGDARDRPAPRIAIAQRDQSGA